MIARRITLIGLTAVIVVSAAIALLGHASHSRNPRYADYVTSTSSGSTLMPCASATHPSGGWVCAP